MRFFQIICQVVFFAAFIRPAIGYCEFISHQPGADRFSLVHAGTAAPLIISSDDYAGVQTMAGHLQADIKRVTGDAPQLLVDTIPANRNVVLIGTIGKSSIIDQLVDERKLNVNSIAGRWDSYMIQTIKNPLPNVDEALVIAGSNKRGTFYGMFELSKQIGVSPWYWWADVAVQQQSDLFIIPGRYEFGEPVVKYRGIFLNDEEPALGRWAVENYGGFTCGFYEKLFELMLRLKANYLWPAMWWASFNTDDPENPKLAEKYGIVMGTTHHEPMNRAHAEWRATGKGDWNYATNKERLQQFWREGIERMGDYETIVTLAMRGDGDMAMSQETNIELLETIVHDQREMLAEVSGKDVTEIPQLWALYKEVQDYYDKGMRVPEDVTLLLCDDNWGNLRKLPLLTDKPRSGGYGIYYHFDYVGGPRNYKWLNTNQIERTWEQMQLAYEYGVDRIWLVNVGDLKPMEFPISFFLDFAWNPNAWPAERLPEYSIKWAEQQFGSEHAVEIAEILNLYTKYNSRRKHELLSAQTYSLPDYREFERIVADFNAITEKAQILYEQMPPESRDAFYQLVLHPTQASANLNDMYFTVAKNRLYAEQGRALTNAMAERVQSLFDKDAAITKYYHTDLADGKWNNMMNQTHISYTYWQQPEKDVLPKVERISLPKRADMGVAIEGFTEWWPESENKAVLPEFDSINRQHFYIDIFNRGQQPFSFSIQPKHSWLQVSSVGGEIETEQRVWTSVDWPNVPAGRHEIPIKIRGAHKKVTVYAVVQKLSDVSPKGFVERNGVVSIHAEHFSHKIDVAPVRWHIIPNLGRTGSAITAFPRTVAAQTPGEACPCLEYDLTLFSKNDVQVHVHVSPTLDFHQKALRYAVSIDDAEPQIVSLHDNFNLQAWEKAVRNNMIETVSTHKIDQPGPHVLKLWLVDPGVVFQKIVIDAGGMQSSYLGPPESLYVH